MIFEQIEVGGDNNFAYLVADESTKKAIVIDPSYSPDKVLELADSYELNIKFLINTHSHYDHINGNEFVLNNTKAELIQCNDGDIIKIAQLSLKTIATPGHSKDSICILVGNKLITGDTLFVGYIGRTWSEEDIKIEFNSLKKLIELPDETEIYPGHNYGEKPFSTIGDEKENNVFFRCVSSDDLESFKKLTQ